MLRSDVHPHTWLGEIHAHERRDTGTLHFKDIVERRDREVVTRQGEAEVGKRIALLAFDRVLPVV